MVAGLRTPSYQPIQRIKCRIGLRYLSLRGRINRFLRLQIPPGNGEDGKHYWLALPDLYARLDAEFALAGRLDGLTCEGGAISYVNPPFGSSLQQPPG